jgi:hypothetical protein
MKAAMLAVRKLPVCQAPAAAGFNTNTKQLQQAAQSTTSMVSITTGCANGAGQLSRHHNWSASVCMGLLNDSLGQPVHVYDLLSRSVKHFNSSCTARQQYVAVAGSQQLGTAQTAGSSNWRTWNILNIQVSA